jgi:hypothetical protein
VCTYVSALLQNIAAFQEYQAAQRELDQRALLPTSSLLSGLVNPQPSIDPDNMTYEELLRLGEEVGDVKKERWRRMAVHVLSSLPTHVWRHSHGEDTYVLLLLSCLERGSYHSVAAVSSASTISCQMIER